MTLRSHFMSLFQQEDLNFLLTNRIPRRLATQFVGWFSKIEQPVIRDLSIGLWRFFSGLDLGEAKKSQFRSMHDCFIRELKDGARPIDRDPNILVSPCDAIVGACGAVAGTTLYQIKGFTYALDDLMGDRAMVEANRDARYVTLRLMSSMYHRFHAPHDCRVEQVTYISGDTWNVNPIALRRVEKLFCKNERVLLKTTLTATGHRRDPGAGGGDPRRQHSVAFPRCPAQPSPPRSQRHPVRRALRKGRRNGMVRARIDHHRARPEGIFAMRYDQGRRENPDGRAADAVAVAMYGGFSLTRRLACCSERRVKENPPYEIPAWAAIRSLSTHSARAIASSWASAVSVPRRPS